MEIIDTLKTSNTWTRENNFYWLNGARKIRQTRKIRQKEGGRGVLAEREEEGGRGESEAKR